MSDPYGPPPASDPDDAQQPTTPPPPQHGQSVPLPQSGQPAPEQPPYGQPTPPSPYGQPAPGQPPYGQPDSGQPPYGQPAPGQPAYGQPPYGQPAPGQPPYGQPAPGQPPYGQPPYGQPGAPSYGQYAAMPSAPPATPYGMAPPLLQVGDALAFGWAKFRANAGSWLLFALVFIAATVALLAPLIGAIVTWANDAVDVADRTGTYSLDVGDVALGGGALLLAVVSGLLWLVAQVLAWNGALREADGERPSLGAFFRCPRVWMGVLAALLLNIGSSVANIVPVVGQIAWAILTAFVMAYVIDHGRPVFEAIGDSFRLVSRSFGQVLLLMLALLGINILGAIPAGLGLLVTLPVSVLAMAYAFRRLTGGTIV